MSHFKTHILTRKAPNQLDKNTNNQIEFTMKLFYRKEFKNILTILINLDKTIFKCIIYTIQPLFEMFKQPLNVSNLSLQNLQGSFLIFPPSSIT